MNIKSRYVDKELSIQSAYESNYSEKSTELKTLLESTIQTRNLKMLQEVKEKAEQIKDLSNIFNEELDVLKLYIASTITSFVEMSIDQGLPKDIAETLKRKYYAMISNCTNITNLKSYNFKIVEELILALHQFSLKKYSPIVKRAIEFIHNHKFKFIFAKDVSNAIKVNRSYLSKKFSEETGQTMTDYIHRVKMEFALKLMKSNFYNYNEIAELLGYRNYSYFSKVFKKIYGKTPYQYMKRYND